MAAPPQRPLVITTCSASKRCRSGIEIDALPRGTQESIAEAWLSRIKSESHLAPARDLYVGRAFGFAVRAAERLGADLGVISAGLGYIRGETPIPSYDLTIRKSGPGSVAGRIDGDFNAKIWWRSVTGGPFAIDLITESASRPLILMCLSRIYAEMIEDDLLAIASINPNAFRIFGLSIGAALPENLRIYALPYDERLNHIGVAGTRVDFPQRAILDYVGHVAPERGGLEFDRSTIDGRMQKVGRIDGSKRRQFRVNDATICQLIADLLPSVGPSRARLLAHIRHKKGLSCEQRRFSKLYDVVRAEMQS